MFVIIVYDVKTKKNPKILKLLRKYCFHVQESVFEGELTVKQLNDFKLETKNIGLDNEDSIIIYSVASRKNIKKESIYKPEKEYIILG